MPVVLALATAAYLIFAALSLFGALVVARYTISFAKHARHLGRSIRRANDGLRAASTEVTAEIARSQDLLNGIAERRERRARPR